MHGRERARRAIAALLASRAESADELAGDAALRPTAPAAGVGAAASETALLAQPAATGDSEWGSSPSRTLVAIDRSGAVMSPLRRYVGRAAAYGALSILSTIGVCSLASGDPLVMALSLVGTAAWGHGILVTRWLEQASALTLRGELDRAEALLRRCLRPPWGSEGVRAHAHLRLSGIATRRGDHAQAVRESRHAVSLFSNEYPPQPQFVQLARYQEIRALVSDGRLPDARYLLEEIGEPPTGDYLRAQHFLTELYVALAEDRMPFLDAPLWDRTQVALLTPQAVPLLALCCWGYYKLGDEEMSAHLLTLTLSRCDEPLERTMPLLWRFLEGRRKAMPAAGAASTAGALPQPSRATS
jgi:hypothetical protein